MLRLLLWLVAAVAAVGMVTSFVREGTITIPGMILGCMMVLMLTLGLYTDK